MIRSMYLILLLSIMGCATQGNREPSSEKEAPKVVSSHNTHFGHTHKHGKDCGHKTETVGFDTVYIHDGHK